MIGLEIEGLNLEKLLREASGASIRLRSVRRIGARRICVSVRAADRAALDALCRRYGWTVSESRAGAAVRAFRRMRGRCGLAAGALLCALLVALGSEMVLAVRITGAQEYEAEVRRILAQQRAQPGSFVRAISADAVSRSLLTQLPGLSYAGVRFDGSTMTVDCRLVRDGERTQKEGAGMDLVAAQAGIVTALVVMSGTPRASIGDAVAAGQVLIEGAERAQDGQMIPVRAQGMVTARVWAKGSARAALTKTLTQETGRTRSRVSVCTPWSEKTVREAQPFDEQDVVVSSEPIVGLYLPAVRRTQTYIEITTQESAREWSDAASIAQGAAQAQAKKQMPANALILDKTVDYSMIEYEFVCADVVLEYEHDIAVRAGE